mmetsp:Transcript_12617/g.19560  ORF Transcript_12617/g.19560 Transcript_12617/m.19560 type:complete len:84 (+) Transcript_12617:86-337(+)
MEYSLRLKQDGRNFGTPKKSTIGRVRWKELFMESSQRTPVQGTLLEIKFSPQDPAKTFTPSRHPNLECVHVRLTSRSRQGMPV